MQPQAIVKKRIIVGTAAQVAGQLFISLLGVLTLKLVTSYLGVQTYGVYATVLTFVSTFALLTDLGLNAINGREIAKHPEQASDIIGHNLGLRITFSLFMIPVIFGLSYLFYPHASHELRYGILFLAGFLLFDAVRATVTGYYTAQVRNDIIAAINSGQQLLITLLIVAVIWLDLGFYGFILSYVVANIIGTAVTLLLVGKKISVRPRVNIARWRGIVAMSLSLGVIQLINMMYLKVDSIMLSVIKGTTSVGIYGIAYSLILAFLSLPSFIMTALIPSLATADKPAVTAIVQKAYQYMLLLACLLPVGVYITRNEIVSLVSNSSFAAAATPLAILGLASAFSYINNVFGFASVALNKHHKIVYISAGVLVLNILLNFILIPKYSFNGAAWATLVSEALAASSIIYIFTKETSVKINIVRPLIKPVLIAAATLGIVLGTRAVLPLQNNLLNLILYSTETLIVYGTLLKITSTLPTEINDYIAKIVRGKTH